ncbi:WYL domain-containing protein [Polaribacter litorisediminis]|uniref:helix-turn-helix transcriptional regulator n=1 Tax=Polaribacter litorisediminis TaxID=1908341 RepID=UPI001CBE9837|nr:WYL domain-containing protein [Polaribacter litorisediminis]UAM97287.1 WYL domain-containing protein [Polaribacter litorisediminis]
MSTHVISRRIQDIIQFIYDTYYPSKNKIISFLETRDFKVSSRTFDRDLERIRSDFGLVISYNKAKEGYFINEQKSMKVTSFFKFLEIVTIADIFSESLANSNTTLEYVSFDDSKSFRGIDSLKTILIAINQNRKICFEHENYLKKTVKKHCISPILLKEYENRWYVIGVTDLLKTTRTFGLDRVKNIKIKELSKVKKEDYSKDLKAFDNIIGLDHENNSNPVKVQLLINELHLNYLRSLPLHHSQVIHSKNEKEQFLVDFYLVPNFEFKSQVLKMGSDALVIHPKSLKNEIRELLSISLARYQE